MSLDERLQAPNTPGATLGLEVEQEDQGSPGPGDTSPQGAAQHSGGDHLPAADTGGLMHTATLQPFLQGTDDTAPVKVKSAGVPVGQEGAPTTDLGLLP